MHDLMQRLRERKLVQWALAYAAGAFALLQGLDIVAQQFAWPDGARRGITVVLVLGFFVALVLAWYHGERGAQRASGSELAIIALLLAIGGGLLWRVAHTTRDDAVSTAGKAEAQQAGREPGTAPQQVSKKSIAVLPFTDLSPGHDQEYFSDGMSEEILNALAKVKDLKVAGRTSAFSFKGKNEDLRSVGRALAVAHVLEGSVRKQGDKVRITAQLIQVEDGYHLWSESYDGDLKDVFELQERIARAITDQLKVVLAGGQTQRLVSVATNNPEAYALYLQGTAIFNRREGPRFPQAIKALEHAIELDPNFARAYSRLAAVLAIANIYMDVPSDTPQAERYARRAAELDPALGEPHAVLAQALGVRQRRYVEAWAEFDQALALEPDDVTANFWHAIFLVQTGYTRAGVERLDRVLSIDPMLPNALFWRGTQHVGNGEMADAERLFQRAVEGGLAYAGAGLAIVAEARGQREEAVRLLAAGFRGLLNTLAEEDALTLARGAYGDAAQRAQALALIEAAAAKPPGHVPAVYLRALLMMGQGARALELSQRHITTNEASYVPMLWQPWGREARRSPAFAEYARKTGLATVWDKYGPPDLCKQRAPGDYVCE